MGGHRREYEVTFDLGLKGSIRSECQTWSEGGVPRRGISVNKSNILQGLSDAVDKDGLRDRLRREVRIQL